jgi:hypothetical protein
MKDALEMAVLTTVSHPNIIQVYNCFTDMVEDAGEGGQGAGPRWEGGKRGGAGCMRADEYQGYRLNSTVHFVVGHGSCFTDMVEDAGEGN